MLIRKRLPDPLSIQVYRRSPSDRAQSIAINQRGITHSRRFLRPTSAASGFLCRRFSPFHCTLHFFPRPSATPDREKKEQRGKKLEIRSMSSCGEERLTDWVSDWWVVDWPPLPSLPPRLSIVSSSSSSSFCSRCHCGGRRWGRGGWRCERNLRHDNQA